MATSKNTGSETKAAVAAAKPKTAAARPAAKKAPVKAASKPQAAAPKKPAAKPQSKPVADAAEIAAAEKRSILFVAGESQPFAASGGLGDVIGSLPAQLVKKGLDVRVVMPLYAEIGQNWRSQMKFVKNFNVALSWRNQYCGIFQIEHRGVTYYFIDNEYYFKRDGLYGFFDDGERFAFFSKAVVELMLEINYLPDIVHAHDWQAGLVPVYLKTIYNDRDEFRRMKLVYTIHNIEYQGKFGIDIMEEVIGIPSWAKSLMDYDGCVNIMKAAIVCSDIVTTVSPTYAKEILSPQFSHGLHFIMESNKNKLRGILNGIDYESYDPEKDRALFANFTAETAEQKALNKTALQKMLNLNVDDSVPMIGIISRLVSHKGVDLIRGALEWILNEKVQVVILGKGDIMYERYFTDLEHSYGNKFKAIIAYNQDLSRKIYAASDLFLMPSKSEPCGLSQMIASRYGAVPIVRETGGLYDSIKDFGCEGGGNGYVFANYDAHDMLYVINKAIADYGSPNWMDKVKLVMKKDFSWERSAADYAEMYRELH